MIEAIVHRVLDHREARAKATPTIAEVLLDVAQAAELLGMSTSYIRKAIGNGRLPAKRIGRAVRVRLADLDTLTSMRRSSSSATPKETDAEWAARIRIAKIRIGGRP